jgi:iron(III) transport system ATP-binding protein
MRIELKRLQRDLGITSVYVTHDQAEALALSNFVAVMRDGRVEQIGKPREIYERPQTRFVAEFLGNANLIDGVVQHADGGVYRLDTVHGELRAGAGADFATGEAVVLSIHSEQVVIEPGPPSNRRPNRWPGTVRARAFRGDAVDYVVGVDGVELRARCGPSVRLPPGTEVTVVVPEDAGTLLPAPD